jgi:biotin carboxylase
MTFLVVGSRPPNFAAAVAALGADYDVVYDVAETPRDAPVAPRAVHWLPYMSDPECLLALPTLFDYDGIVSFVDYGALPAALAASVAGLPGPSVQAVLGAHNKHLMRTVLRRAGLAQPAFGLVGHTDPAPADYPVLVKPVDGMGSSGLRLVESPAGLCAIPRTRQLMWESRVDGPQYTVEGVAGSEGHDALAVTGKVVTGPPHFVVLDHETPAPVDAGTRDLLVSYAARCLTALGVRDTATHTEIALDRGTPVIIETHTRPAGDRVPFITRLTTGWDQCELALCRASTVGLVARRHPIVGAHARTIHLTPYDSARDRLANPDWLAEHPEVVSFDFSRIYSNRVSAHDSRWGHDPRWGNVVLAGPDRERLVAVGAEIRARASGGG